MVDIISYVKLISSDNLHFLRKYFLFKRIINVESKTMLVKRIIVYALIHTFYCSYFSDHIVLSIKYS